jgi:hypothetical protein
MMEAAGLGGRAGPAPRCSPSFSAARTSAPSAHDLAAAHARADAVIDVPALVTVRWEQLRKVRKLSSCRLAAVVVSALLSAGLSISGGLGRPRTCDRRIMSRFTAVRWMLACHSCSSSRMRPPDALLLCPVAADGMTEGMTAALPRRSVVPPDLAWEAGMKEVQTRDGLVGAWRLARLSGMANDVAISRPGLTRP